MGAKRAVAIPIRNAGGVTCGELWLYVLPTGKQDEAVLWDMTDDLDADPTLEPFQILEGQSYRYRFEMPGLPEQIVIETSHPGVFEPHVESGREGRLNARLHTGSITVRVQVMDGVEIGTLAFEVRSKKFDYLHHYRWMLQDIAAELTETLMERFGTAEQRFDLAETKPASITYQQFAFLKHLISGDSFEAAVHQILARPHRAWVEEQEWRAPGQGIRGGGNLARQLMAATGRKVPWSGGPRPFLPAEVRMTRTDETLDTPENRFIKFALTRWRDLAAEVERSLANEKESGPVIRGKREVRAVLERLDELLASRLFAGVGRLRQVPVGSQVLQKRAGYRDLFRAYVQFESAASLTWDGGDEIYQAGLRNVATLYEYWVFLKLRRSIAALCEEHLHEEALFEVKGGLHVRLRRGETIMVSGECSRHGRRLRLELYFNRSFTRDQASSWTLKLVPDCSLRILPAGADASPLDEVWLHFDAKYRIKTTSESDTPDQERESVSEGEDGLQKTGSAQENDLLKMHAYRDAIHRTAGAYVIFPGSADQPRPFRRYEEILPGLGAFPLQPVHDGEPTGLVDLHQFLSDVLDHTASQYNQHARTRYWERRITMDGSPVERVRPMAPFLVRPPADTQVILGDVKDEAHHDWIKAHGLYNLRADSGGGTVGLHARELAADLVVLYSVPMGLVEVWKVDGPPLLLGRSDLADRHYPNPRGTHYLCLQISPLPWSEWDTEDILRRVEVIRSGQTPTPLHGAPMATTWLELLS